MEDVALISARHLFKIYTAGDEELYALNDVSLDIASGEFLAIMGSSGSGKSTFMNILGLLDEPTKGEYFFGGRTLPASQKRKEHTGAGTMWVSCSRVLIFYPVQPHLTM